MISKLKKYSPASDKILVQAIKYSCVGVANTLVTISIIFMLMWLGTNLYFSNAVGYACGIILSYLLNCKFVFAKTWTGKRFVKFLLVAGCAYLANLLALSLSLYFYPTALYISQLVGAVIYTSTGFILNKFWGMK